jgi:hypothetical protein
MVLREKYWTTICSQVQGEESLMEAIAGKVYFFSLYATAKERLNFTCNEIDFEAGPHMVFFWKPQLKQVLDFNILEQESLEKHKKAAEIRAYVRRALTRKIWISNSGRSQRDLRPALFKLHRMALKDRVNLSSVLSQLKKSKKVLDLFNHWEDEEIPKPRQVLALEGPSSCPA